MAVFLAPLLNDQQVDANGDPLSGGKIYVYLAGSSTPVTTYSDKAGLVPNTNPLILNTLGVNTQGAVWLTGGSTYKYVIQNAAGVTQRTIDNISGVNDTTVALDQWVVYQATPTYVSATSFTVAGDQTQTFQLGRRVKTTNTGGVVVGTVTASTYSAPNTTVVVRNDSGVLDSGLSAVSYGLISTVDSSLPGAFRLGQCRLVKSGANLVLQPYQGNQLTINGAAQTVPSAGVTLAPTSSVVGTLYYIYAYMNAGVMALEYSTTGHSTDANTGMEIKTGDPTRTLVGMARPITGPAWTDTSTQRFVVSWFNQRPVALQGVGTADYALPAVIGAINTAFNAEFLTWATNAVNGAFAGGFITGTAGTDSYLQIALDNAGVLPLIRENVASATQRLPAAASAHLSMSEGYHYLTMFGQTGSGTPAYVASNSVLNATIQG